MATRSPAPHAQLQEADAEVLHPVGHLTVADVRPAAFALGPERDRPAAEPVHRLEVELVQRGRRGASYWNRMMKRWPEPGTGVSSARLARIATIAVSGAV